MGSIVDEQEAATLGIYLRSHSREYSQLRSAGGLMGVLMLASTGSWPLVFPPAQFVGAALGAIGDIESSVSGQVDQ